MDVLRICFLNAVIVMQVFLKKKKNTTMYIILCCFSKHYQDFWGNQNSENRDGMYVNPATQQRMYDYARQMGSL